MLQTFPEQDENSIPAHGVLARAGSKQDAPRPRVSKTPFGPSARRALGNITNTSRKQQEPREQHNSLPQKKSLSTRTTAPPTVGKPPIQKAVRTQTKAATIETAAAMPPSSLDLEAAQLASEGTERRAGDSWHKQEAIREWHMHQDIKARIDAICSRRYAAPCFMAQDQWTGKASMRPPHIYERPPEMPESPRPWADTGQGDLEFTVADLPEIWDGEWTIKIRPEFGTSQPEADTENYGHLTSLTRTLSLADH